MSRFTASNSTIFFALKQWETSWKIIKISNNTTTNTIIAFGPPTGSNYERRTRYIGQFCLQYGNYKLRMKDRNNDGLCCQYGQVRIDVLLVAMSAMLVSSC